jgi:MrcB-like, N-terminal domain/Domain of unknown function (DUF3883)
MTIKSILKRICELQPKYSSSNTPEMQERGELVRNNLAGELKARLPALQKFIDPLFDDLAVEASDGIGRKTEAPWVRLFSKTMSPNPRQGFYMVIHFAADGSALYVTLGCGSTVWRGGSLIPVSDEELLARTSWAKQVIVSKWRNTDPFNDVMQLGAIATLPRTFEKATSVAKRVSIDQLDYVDFDTLFADAMVRLGEIYLAQIDNRDVSPGDQIADEIISISKPLRKRSGRQGFSLTGPQRKAVELQAMEMATRYLKDLGYICRDTSANESYDILATMGSEQLKIEVKGTTSDFCDSVVMTKNEVDLHRAEKGTTGLIIVSKIQLDKTKETPAASGGSLDVLLKWDIDIWSADPIAFQVSRTKN